MTVNSAASQHRVEVLARFDPIELSKDQSDDTEWLRHKVKNLAESILVATTPSREQSMALTALEETARLINRAIATRKEPT